MKTRWLMLVAAALPLFTTAAKDQSPLAIHVGPAQIEIRHGAKPLLVYATAPHQFKPYVQELYTLRGENVLRDAPPDHLHHHGLMYAIRVNGVNFWEERDAPGVQKPVKLLGRSVGRTATGLSQAKFTQLIHWLAPDQRKAADTRAAALLIEKRTLTLTVDEAAGEVALQWDAAFQVGKGGKVALQGTDYNGLGLRLPQSFDRVAVFQNSEKAPYTGAHTRDNLRARWTSVTGRAATGEITLALYGSPVNPGGDTSFFTLREPFAYLSATQALDQKERAYAPGEKFRLSYLLAVYHEPKSADFLQRRYDEWNRVSK